MYQIMLQSCDAVDIIIIIIIQSVLIIQKYKMSYFDNISFY